MKVIHVLKKIEQLDEDIKELRKMEKSLQRNKSFSTPIYMMIEKQINILLGDRIKLLELKVENPPEHLAKEFDGEKTDSAMKPLRKQDKKGSSKKEVKQQLPDKQKSKKTTTAKSTEKTAAALPDDDIPMMTQDMIDSKFASMKKVSAAKPENKETQQRNLLISKKDAEPLDSDEEDDKDVKLLDIALEKGTLNKDVIDKEKKRVRFFRDNFPGGEY